MAQQPSRTDELNVVEAFHGVAIRPGEPGYDQARAVYNASIDRHPALVLRPHGAADVIDAVNLAREQELPLAARCGGHSVAGNGTVDGGILVDLSALKGVHVDAAAGTARANAGVLWGEFDRETQLFGLATPGGRVTTTGVGGFCTGGGYGWLSPKFGLTCDNLISADVVTADGRLVTASETENPDLFWGIRGGGSNFGIVTSFEFRVHPVGPIVLAGLVIYPFDGARAIVRAYRDYTEKGPDELATALTILHAPPAPFVPEPLHGEVVLGVAMLWIGDAGEGDSYVAPLRELGPPAADLVQPMPYTVFQAMLDPFNPPGWQNYHRGIHLSALTEDAIDAYLEVGSRMPTPTPTTQAVMFRHGGAVTRIPDDATAVGHRDAVFMAHPIACWQDPAETPEHIEWVRRFSAAMEPHATGVYLNFEPDEGEDRVLAGYGREKYARLVALKDRWDPDNLFRVNQNIRPSRAATKG